MDCANVTRFFAQRLQLASALSARELFDLVRAA
jgi:hypothetical protein